MKDQRTEKFSRRGFSQVDIGLVRSGVIDEPKMCICQPLQQVGPKETTKWRIL